MTSFWPQRDRYHSYAGKYLTMDFLQLIDSLHAIEDDILDQIAADLLDVLESTPSAEVRGDVILVAKQPHQLSLRRDQGSRELRVYLLPLAQEPGPLVSSVDRVSLFGQVGSLAISVPRGLAWLRELIRERCLQHLKNAYTALRIAYQSAYARWTMAHFEAVYAVINTELLVNGAGQLCNRFWLSVTDIREARFKYYLGSENLGSAADWLTQRQDESLSPCLALTILITKEVADGFFLPATAPSVVRLDSETFVLKFTQLPTLGSDTAFWHAERRLFSSGELAAIKVIEVDGRAFEVNCTAENVAAIKAAVEGVRADLGTIITNRYRDFQRDRKRLEASLRKATGAAALIKDVGTDIVAKFLAEVVKT